MADLPAEDGEDLGEELGLELRATPVGLRIRCVRRGGDVRGDKVAHRSAVSPKSTKPVRSELSGMSAVSGP